MHLTANEKNQIKRIKKNSVLLEDKDPKFEAFGASSHKYIWNKTTKEKLIHNFEEKHGIILPRMYRIYLLYISNGGPGLGYGLYPLEKAIIFANINKENIFYPYMSQEKYNHTVKDLSLVEAKAIFNGLLTIGFENGYKDIALIITGEYRGRMLVVKNKTDEPFLFISDKNFLDWYERWITDIINDLDMNTFAESFAGSQSDLRDLFIQSRLASEKVNILTSIARYDIAEEETLLFYQEQFDENQTKSIKSKIMTNFIRKAPERVFENVDKLIYSDDPDLLEVGIESINLLENCSRDISRYLPRIIKIMPYLNPDLFFIACLLLEKTEFDFCKTFIPFFKHKNAQCRKFAVKVAGDTPDFMNYLEEFTDALLDRYSFVVLAAIQTLAHSKDIRFLPYYKTAWLNFPDDRDYIRSNIRKILKDFGLSENDL